MRHYLNRNLVIACVGLGFALPLACGGSSEFSSGDGEAGEPNTGGSNAGTSGASTGGLAGTAAVGGTSGSSTGGRGGTSTGGRGGTTSGGTGAGGTNSGGTDPGGAGGDGASGGSGGATGGSAGRGGTAGQGGFQTGGTGGQMGGSAGVGGMPDSRCPLRNPAGTPCDANGLECRYDLSRNCLCITVVQPGFCSVWDARCDAMMGAAPPPPDAGGIAIPVSTQTCQCNAGTWACRYP